MALDAPPADSSPAPDAPGTAVVDAPPADSSPAPEAYTQEWIDSLNPAQREQWQLNGEDPTSTDSPTDADSAPAAPEKQAASTDATPDTPASEPGSPAKGEKLKARTAELDEEIQGLHERLRIRSELRQELARREGPAKADPAPAPASAGRYSRAELDRYRAMPGAPTAEQYEDVNDYYTAMGLFVSDKRHEEASAQDRAVSDGRARYEAFTRTAKEAVERVRVYQEQHPDFGKTVHPDLMQITPASLVPEGETVGPHHALAEEVIKSEATPQLLEHFSNDPEDWQRLCELAPADLLRAFGRLEARLLTAAPVPPLKHVSDSPEPPTVLGRKPAQKPNDVEGAMTRGDYAAYEAAANAADIAAAGN
jgi:hypothetical protein|tara:strand:+ start:423 stop:1520 length:1098 start_codon:yes stop_codon:yes gene_type:complete